VTIVTNKDWLGTLKETYRIGDYSDEIMASTLRQNSRRGFCKKERKRKEKKR
jgi:hypothetical protein